MAAKKVNSSKEILNAIDGLIEKSKRPLVIFDLDGTLFNVSYRHLAIFKNFLKQDNILQSFPEQCAILQKITPHDFKYGIEATLNAAGIDRYSEHSAHFIKLVESYWFKHFFTDEYVLCDETYLGAVECVKHFKNKGVHVVYLSGRDIPNMSRGTLGALEKYGFPHSGHGVSLVLKPAYGLDDLLFKKQAMDTIRSEGTVIATFDNEPANVQMFSDEFPEGVHIHYESQFAREMDLTGPNLYAIKTFAEIGF